ncbi:pancreatic triacylglycerol lipase-like [Camponotus floridanus]|uniref:pancreatic triacylglycerol lipase-like n=1 Tax=Camponotus floridanus TaxID=104421 RepID=UPI00059CEB55|nr:pancreatic triacylglycerol lipase-like [Camponotus floridanus]XP_011259269.1 pancreatic triacylglycerol lipase-like [Camponotus floridanus]
MKMVSLVLVFTVLWQFFNIRECSCLWQLHATNITRPLQDALNRTTYATNVTGPFQGALNKTIYVTNVTRPLQDSLNRTMHGAKKIMSLFNETTLANFTYTIHVGVNSSELDIEEFGIPDFEDSEISPSSETFSRVAQVDCFGLGKTVATTLEWFFRSEPNGSNALDVRFYLSSRKQPYRVEVILGEQFGLEWTNFNIERRTVMIVHGFLSNGNETWINNMEKALLQWDDVNVVVVDWSAGGNTWNYYKAAVNTKIVGYQISKFIEHVTNATINERSDTNNWGLLHLIGHSLGAHICGMAAKELKGRRNRWMVQRITGLDPAQPCFRNADPSVHLNKNDAPFVDVIHTNGRLLFSLGLGLPEIIGHVDFYPNGGKMQPGCEEFNSIFDYLPIPATVIRKAICSHGRSYLYFTESVVSATVNNCSFWAHKWNRTPKQLSEIIVKPCNVNICTEMGIRAEMYDQRGCFFLSTTSTYPFCANSTDRQGDGNTTRSYKDKVKGSINNTLTYL